MKTPESLVAAVDCGIIEEVLRPLMSGKEAQVYVVVAAGRECVAKVYKEATQRTFKHRAEYTEGRRTRNSRDQRAIKKRSRHGRSQDEAGWRSTEADMMSRLHDAGVRVPELINFLDGVLVMELVKDAEGHPAPRLGDLSPSPDEAVEIYQRLLREVVRMLCAGVIHGDLSDFNVLLSADGPVLIDFPQSLDPASNQGARKFLLRDVENLHRFVKRNAPEHATRAFGEEMWSLYEANRLAPDTELRGDYRASEIGADTGEVMALIEDADRDEYARREARGEKLPRTEPAPTEPARSEAPREAPLQLRTVVDFTKQATPRPGARKKRASRRQNSRAEASPSRGARKPAAAKAAASAGDAAPKKKRGRRRRRKSSELGGEEARTSAPPGPDRGRTASAKRGAASGEANTPRARTRRPRSGARSKSGEVKAAAPTEVERSNQQDGARRGGTRSTAPADGAARPPRRRRRRPRSAGSREST